MEEKREHLRGVLAVIVSYNRLEMLKECIQSIERQEGCTCDILVVNNGSTDGTREYLDTRSDLRVVHQENVGGAGGFYTGMKYAVENGYDYTWIMDDDVECTGGTLKSLYSLGESLGGDFGYLCSPVYNSEGEVINSPTIDLERNQYGYAGWYGQLRKGAIAVKEATFVSVYIPCRNIERYGLPYREFFIWGDDTEYTRRLRKEKACYMTTGGEVVHKRKGGSNVFLEETNPNRQRLYYYNLRNTAYNKRKTGGARWMLIAHLDFVKLFVQCMIRLKFRHLGIAIKAYAAYLTFSPKVDYPKRKE
ncbi:MAG: glycosyltransferase [Bacteroidales bacterium]|nr:glycosyltransferase [Bacteroidales bacterium]